MRLSLLFVILALGVSGCGGGSATSQTPTSIASTKVYTDHRFKFSFKYPTAWKVPAGGGHQETVSGTPTYVVPVTAPGDVAQLEVTVDGRVFQIPDFTDGKTAPAGGDATYHYFHARVGGLPAMRVERREAQKTNEVDTLFNTRTRSYDVRILTASPPLSVSSLQAYRTIVGSISVPFS